MALGPRQVRMMSAIVWVRPWLPLLPVCCSVELCVPEYALSLYLTLGGRTHNDHWLLHHFGEKVKKLFQGIQREIDSRRSYMLLVLVVGLDLLI